MKHKTALKKVCGICLMKQKSMENISDQYLILIKKHHFENYNLTSGDYLTVIARLVRGASETETNSDMRLRENCRL